MPVSFSVKNVPDHVAGALRTRARRNHRSLQGELLAVLEAAARPDDAAASEVREAPAPWPEPSSAPVTAPRPSDRTPAPPGEFVVDRGKLADLCRRHHIRRLSVFGSALRPDFGPEGDVDFLAEFDERHPVGLRIFDVEADLAGLLGGRRPDLVNPKSLNARLKAAVLASAKVLYAEG